MASLIQSNLAHRRFDTTEMALRGSVITELVQVGPQIGTLRGDTSVACTRRSSSSRPEQLHV